VQLATFAPLAEPARELPSATACGMTELVAEILPGVRRAVAKLTTLASDVVTCACPALRCEEERRPCPESRAEERAGGKDGDVLPVQLVVVRSRASGRRTGYAAWRDRKLALEHASSGTPAA